MLEFLKAHPMLVNAVGVALAVAVAFWPKLKPLLGGLTSILPGVDSKAAAVPDDPRVALRQAVDAYSAALASYGVCPAEQRRLLLVMLKLDLDKEGSTP